MKILHVISSIDLESGGPSKSVCDLALYQAKQGVYVTVYTQTSSNPYLEVSSIFAFKIIFSDSSSFKIDLQKLIEFENFDLLHGHGIWELPVHYMAEFARKYNIPYIITPRGTLFPWALNVNKWKKKVAMLFYQKKDLDNAFCLHATSQKEADYLRDFGIKIPISVISNGLEIDEISIVKTRKVSQKRTLLFLSRVHTQKGLSFLIDAWEKLDFGIRKNWSLEIAGNGDVRYIDLLKKNILEKGLDHEIKIIGPLFGEEKLSAFRSADLFVLPSFSENFGIVVAEALAFGVPVITTKGTPWEELNTYNAGWWIDIGVSPLVEALEKAFSLSDKEREVMGRNGRRLIEEKYSIVTVAQQMVYLYKWVLRKGEKPRFIYE